MQALKVSKLSWVSGFGECFETHLDQLNNTAAQDSLFAEEICFCFIFKGRVDNRSPSATNRRSIRLSQLQRFSAVGVLSDGDQIRNTTALNEFSSDGVAWCFRSNHDHVQIRTRSDLAVVDCKAVTES